MFKLCTRIIANRLETEQDFHHPIERTTFRKATTQLTVNIFIGIRILSLYDFCGRRHTQQWQYQTNSVRRNHPYRRTYLNEQ